MVHLDTRYKDILFEPRFYILPDESHLSKNNTGHSNLEIFEQLESVYSQKKNLSVLFGDYESPYIRLDPFFMGVVDEEDDEAKKALEHIVSQIDKAIIDISLQPGEVLFVDNFRAVHGRKPFTAKYEGKDRWLKRINITRDIRKSRDSRNSADSRLIQPRVRVNSGTST